MAKTDDKWLTVRVSERIQDAVRGVARRENRRLTEQVRQFIVEGLERRSIKVDHNGEPTP